MTVPHFCVLFSCSSGPISPNVVSRTPPTEDLIPRECVICEFYCVGHQSDGECGLHPANPQTPSGRACQKPPPVQVENVTRETAQERMDTD